MSGAPVTKSSPRLPVILTWEDPIRSGTVLAELVGALAVVRYGNLLRLALRLVFYAIGFTGIVELVSRKFYGSSTGLIFSLQPSRYVNISQKSIEYYTSQLAGVVAYGVGEVKKLLDAEDLGLSLGAFIATYSAYLLTGFVSPSSLLLLVVVLAFTLPPLYIQFQKEIDEVVGLVHKHASDKYTEVHGHVMKAAGPHIDVARGHVNNVASKVGLNLNVNRGGFPSNDKPGAAAAAAPAASTGPSASAPAPPPGPAAKIPSELSDNSLAAKAAAVGATTEAEPKVSAQAAEILKAHDDFSTFDSVPTLIGNVSLDPNAPAKAQ